jgi:hypothetical protein
MGHCWPLLPAFYVQVNESPHSRGVCQRKVEMSYSVPETCLVTVLNAIITDSRFLRRMSALWKKEQNDKARGAERHRIVTSLIQKYFSLKD